MARTRPGTIIVAIVLALGLGVGSLGAWWVMHARPRPGEFIDVLATPDGVVAVRREQASANAFVEVYDGDRLRWRGVVPRYAGRPGVPAVAASARSVTVRVVRAGQPLVFAFDAVTGKKVDSFGLVPDAPPDAAAYTLATVATVSDGRRGAELLATPGGGALVIGVDLDQRRLAWKRELPAPPADAWIAGDLLVLDLPAGRRALALDDGADRAAPDGPPPPAPAAVVGVTPARHHAAGGRIWVVTPRAITAHDATTLAPIATIR